MNGYKIVLLKAILCFIGCRKVNGYAPEYVQKIYFSDHAFSVSIIFELFSYCNQKFKKIQF